MSAVTPSAYSVVVDGRFKGGYITRTYGNPGRGVQAIQLEINQNVYLAAGSPPQWDDEQAARLSAVLRIACEGLLRAAAAVHAAGYEGSVDGVPATTVPVHALPPSQ